MTEAALDVLYQDSRCAVINKPAGLMVHASGLARGEDDFLLHRLRVQFDSKVHLVHRLDRATSGCMLVAFDAEAASVLGQAFMDRDVGKDYLAICRGWPELEFTIDHDLDGGPGKPEKKPAVTSFCCLATAELPMASAVHPTSRYALLQCTPVTGRFRQIRRHLKHVSHHLIGDTSHGDGRHNRAFRMLGVHRMLLHAWRLRFPHPESGEIVACSAPLDVEFRKALTLLGMPRQADFRHMADVPPGLKL
ncbi:pseudouridine synthase [Arenimonas sp.]|uniref:pseudouridine synthase n=1 Tax=Arenimonas sp. TaxID=1872635 RepID=UPI0037BF3FB0